MGGLGSDGAVRDGYGGNSPPRCPLEELSEKLNAI